MGMYRRDVLHVAVLESYANGTVGKDLDESPGRRDAIQGLEDVAPQLLIRPDEVRPEAVQFTLEVGQLGIVGVAVLVPAAEVMLDVFGVQAILRLWRDEHVG
jgi:hypothetical protein